MGSQDTTAGRGMESARIAAGYTLAQAADAVTRDVQSVRRWESGQSVPPQHVQIKLAHLYGCTPQDLLSPSVAS